MQVWLAGWLVAGMALADTGDTDTDVVDTDTDVVDTDTDVVDTDAAPVETDTPSGDSGDSGDAGGSVTGTGGDSGSSSSVTSLPSEIRGDAGGCGCGDPAAPISRASAFLLLGLVPYARRRRR